MSSHFPVLQKLYFRLIRLSFSCIPMSYLLAFSIIPNNAHGFSDSHLRPKTSFQSSGFCICSHYLLQRSHSINHHILFVVRSHRQVAVFAPLRVSNNFSVPRSWLSQRQNKSCLSMAPYDFLVFVMAYGWIVLVIHASVFPLHRIPVHGYAIYVSILVNWTPQNYTNPNCHNSIRTFWLHCN